MTIFLPEEIKFLTKNPTVKISTRDDQQYLFSIGAQGGKINDLFVKYDGKIFCGTFTEVPTGRKISDVEIKSLQDLKKHITVLKMEGVLDR